MPGMMDTVLNLGLNDITVEGLAAKSGNPRFAFDSYRRFIQMYANVVLGLSSGVLDDYLEQLRDDQGVYNDSELTVDSLKGLVETYKRVIEEQTGEPFPQSPAAQLWSAIGAVFDSWNNRRAIDYREAHGIPDDIGTAVNVQAMVFGNMGESSATGVAFTRDPKTGERKFFGEWLRNAQGEDVVAGIRTPQPINADSGPGEGRPSKRRCPPMPNSYTSMGNLSHTTATCKTSSLPSSKVACGCSKPAQVSAHRGLGFASPLTWPMKGSSQNPRPSCGSRRRPSSGCCTLSLTPTPSRIDDSRPRGLPGRSDREDHPPPR